jgi:hypothetical protein
LYKQLDVALFDWLAYLHKKDTSLDNYLFIGPVAGAHNPIYFARPDEYVKKVIWGKKVSIYDRLSWTGAMYKAHHRIKEHAERMAYIGIDFDFDRGKLEGLSRHLQETILLDVLDRLPPSTAVKTSNGFHLYWILEKPENIFDTGYCSLALTSLLSADPRSTIPTQPFSIYGILPKKANAVNRIILPEIDATVKLFPYHYRTYTTEAIHKILKNFNKKTAKSNNTIKLMKLAQGDSGKKGVINKLSDVEREELFLKRSHFIQQVDLPRLLKSFGLYGRMSTGKKLMMICPYHDDHHPSAFINLDPTSPYYGMFHCSSCNTTVSIESVVRKITGEDLVGK